MLVLDIQTGQDIKKVSMAISSFSFFPIIWVWHIFKNQHFLTFTWNHLPSNLSYMRELINWGSNNKNTILFSKLNPLQLKYNLLKVLVDEFAANFPLLMTSIRPIECKQLFTLYNLLGYNESGFFYILTTINKINRVMISYLISME